MTEFAKWLGVTKDSKRPNWGAALLAIAAVLLAMGYKPEDVTSGGNALVGMAEALIAFIAKPDNALATVIGGAGWLMSRGKSGDDLTDEERAMLKKQAAAWLARQAAAQPPLELDK
jgi:hypothetical protein